MPKKRKKTEDSSDYEENSLSNNSTSNPSTPFPPPSNVINENQNNVESSDGFSHLDYFIILENISPHFLFELFLDSEKHSKFTQQSSHISRKVNGKFSYFNGIIEGSIVQLTQDQKIVQKWRLQSWSPEHYSFLILTFRGLKVGTKVIFQQQNIPNSSYQFLSTAWYQ